MPVEIKEIKNLTQNKTAGPELPADKFKDFTSNDRFSDTITAESNETYWGNFAEANDNIQVTWKGDNDKVIARGVGGRFVKVGNKVTISGLKDVSKLSAEVAGELAIGPEGDSTSAALLRIRIGNMVSETNKSGDTIINFSDKTDSAGGSEINLKVLIDWILQKSGNNTDVPKLPKIDDGNGGTKKPEDFIIVFKNFYYNITQNTFDFWVESKSGSEIKFGNFTIKKASFRITNMPTAAEVKEAPKALPAPAPAV